MLDEVTSGLRKQHLPSVPSTHNACGMMHVQTSVSLGGKRWFASMDTHTDTHDHSVGPDMRGEGTLCCHCTSRGIGGASKSHEEGTSLSLVEMPHALSPRRVSLPWRFHDPKVEGSGLLSEADHVTCRMCLLAHRPGKALSRASSRSRCTSRIGGTPKRLLYSRLKWEASWYPTR